MSREPLLVESGTTSGACRDAVAVNADSAISSGKSATDDAIETSVDRPAAALPFVSVIVPVFQDLTQLRGLWDALSRQDYAQSRFECILIENDVEPSGLSHDAPFAVQVLHEPQPGSYAARNRGLRAARGAVLAFTDADCRPQSDWLSSAVSALRAASAPCVIAGRIEMVARRPDSVSAFEWHSIANELQQSRYVDRFHFGATANVVTTRAVFEQAGDFDAGLLSSGDLEWGQRLRAQGIPVVYRDDVSVRHPARDDWRSSASKSRRVLGGHYVLASRKGRPFWPTLKSIVRFGIVSIRRSWRDPHLPGVSCRLQVILIDLGLRCVQCVELVRLSCGGSPRRS